MHYGHHATEATFLVIRKREEREKALSFKARRENESPFHYQYIHCQSETHTMPEKEGLMQRSEVKWIAAVLLLCKLILP